MLPQPQSTSVDFPHLHPPAVARGKQALHFPLVMTLKEKTKKQDTSHSLPHTAVLEFGPSHHAGLATSGLEFVRHAPLAPWRGVWDTRCTPLLHRTPVSSC